MGYVQRGMAVDIRWALKSCFVTQAAGHITSGEQSVQPEMGPELASFCRDRLKWSGYAKASIRSTWWWRVDRRATPCSLLPYKRQQKSRRAGAEVSKSSPGGEKAKAYSTRYSQAVTHPSTDRARRCLTSQIGRDGVCSTWYGRRH